MSITLTTGPPLTLSAVCARLLYEDANLLNSAVSGGNVQAAMPASNGTDYPAFYTGINRARKTVVLQVSSCNTMQVTCQHHWLILKGSDTQMWTLASRSAKYLWANLLHPMSIGPASAEHRIQLATIILYCRPSRVQSYWPGQQLHKHHGRDWQSHGPVPAG